MQTDAHAPCVITLFRLGCSADGRPGAMQRAPLPRRNAASTPRFEISVSDCGFIRFGRSESRGSADPSRVGRLIRVAWAGRSESRGSADPTTAACARRMLVAAAGRRVDASVMLRGSINHVHVRTLTVAPNAGRRRRPPQARPVAASGPGGPAPLTA